MSALEYSSHTSYCPYKGDCTYFGVADGDSDSEMINVAWTYESPYPAVENISTHVAFYPDRVDEITITP